MGGKEDASYHQKAEGTGVSLCPSSLGYETARR